MSNPERVETDQNGCPPRRGHFVAAHIVLYLTTIVRFILVLYMYFIDLGTKYALYFWIIQALLPTALLFSR